MTLTSLPEEPTVALPATTLQAVKALLTTMEGRSDVLETQLQDVIKASVEALKKQIVQDILQLETLLNMNDAE
jgi:hypothetical protein